MAVKKAYQEIVTFLQENEGVKVNKILPQVIEMASAKRGGGSTSDAVLKDANGNVVAIQDYYFKRYMPIVGDNAVEFGAKKNSPTGLSNMSKLGTSLYTKQQRVAKQEGANLLTRVAAGEVAPTDIEAEQAKIEEARMAIQETDLGFATKDEVIAHLATQGVEALDPTASAE